MGKYINVTDESFQADVLDSDIPVLVDFWAPWCGPCRALAPHLDTLADEFDGQVKVAKVNVDENPISPGNLGVRGIPALFLFKDGEVVSNKMGALPKTALNEWIVENI